MSKDLFKSTSTLGPACKPNYVKDRLSAPTKNDQINLIKDLAKAWADSTPYDGIIKELLYKKKSCSLLLAQIYGIGEIIIGDNVCHGIVPTGEDVDAYTQIGLGSYS